MDKLKKEEIKKRKNKKLIEQYKIGCGRDSESKQAADYC